MTILVAVLASAAATSADFEPPVPVIFSTTPGVWSNW
jgi:hypothetical protein